MKIYIIAILIVNLLYPSDNNSLPKLDLRDADDLKLDIKIDNLFKKFEIEEKNILIQAQIDLIKENSRNYEVEPVNEDDIIILETNLGVIKLKFFPNVAPNHCLNFKKLANSGFYDKTLFHRVIPGFMIQGGDILTRDGFQENDGTGNPGWTINAEFSDIKHKRGILSMARSTDPNSAGSQFFICVADAFHLDGAYSVFGEVIENEHVLDIIANIPSESEQVSSMSRLEIPINENKDDWLTYTINKKSRFFKIPPNQTKESYLEYIKRKIRNKSRPSIPVTIKKIRVIDKGSITK